MDKYKYLFFGIMLLLQLAVPLSMIYSSEKILISGKEFRFRCEPVDPSDLFRGQYLTLNYKNNNVKVDSPDRFNNKDVFGVLTTDQENFARFSSATISEPISGDYLKTNVISIGDQEVTLDIPFQTYYMDENKASMAEQIYRKQSGDSSFKVYSKVRILNGKGKLHSVFINDSNILDILKNNTE
jgi:uncharacterized membrane-anchored protein